jgi:hypothetical protein
MIEGRDGKSHTCFRVQGERLEQDRSRRWNLTLGHEDVEHDWHVTDDHATSSRPKGEVRQLSIRL